MKLNENQHTSKSTAKSTQKTDNMNYITYSRRLEYLLEMIEKGQVSSPKVVAEKFGCSEKTIRNMINCLREKGLKIGYFKYNKKYLLKK